MSLTLSKVQQVWRSLRQTSGPLCSLSKIPKGLESQVFCFFGVFLFCLFVCFFSSRGFMSETRYTPVGEYVIAFVFSL